LVVQAAVELGLEDGQKLRVDTTVVQTDIHHPTHNTLLWDVVRVVARLIGRLAKTLERQRIKGFRDRTRSARRRMQEIQRMTPRQRRDRQTRAYSELIELAIAQTLRNRALGGSGRSAIPALLLLCLR
jgi:IS5 family transposase